MLSYIIRRILLMVPTLFGVTAVVFFVMAWSPGGVGQHLQQAGGELDAKTRDALRTYYEKRYGLGAPRAVQYGRWLNKVSPIGFASGDGGKVIWSLPRFKAPDMGESFSKRRPVLDLYAEALPVTLVLNLISVPFVYLVSILAGVYMARYRGKGFDVLAGGTFLGFWSVPTIWAGVMMIGLLANRQYLQWFPVGGLNATLAEQMSFLPGFVNGNFERGWLLDRLWHLLLPITCLTYSGFAFLSKLTRSAMLENLSSDYVRTARAKGVSQSNVLWCHAFRNSLLPLITVAAGILPGLLVGSVIVETIFSIPGMGKLTVDAIFARDRELVLAGTFVGGLLGLACLLIADLCYAVADPRVSYE